MSDSALQVLREMIQLRDMKIEADALITSGSWENVHRQEAARNQFNDAMPLLWERARRAVYEADSRRPTTKGEQS